jgi:hypothetical protein
MRKSFSCALFSGKFKRLSIFQAVVLRRRLRELHMDFAAQIYSSWTLAQKSHLFSIASGVGLSPLYCGHFWPTVQPQMICEGDCGAVGGMKIGKGNRSIRRNPPQRNFVHHNFHLIRPRYRTRAVAVGSQRLTAYYYWVSGLCAQSRILKNREHNVSEKGSASVIRWVRDSYSLYLCLKLTVSKGSSGLCVSLHI